MWVRGSARPAEDPSGGGPRLDIPHVLAERAFIPTQPPSLRVVKASGMLAVLAAHSACIPEPPQPVVVAAIHRVVSQPNFEPFRDGPATDRTVFRAADDHGWQLPPAAPAFAVRWHADRPDRPVDHVIIHTTPSQGLHHASPGSGGRSLQSQHSPVRRAHSMIVSALVLTGSGAASLGLPATVAGFAVGLA